MQQCHLGELAIALRVSLHDCYSYNIIVNAKMYCCAYSYIVCHLKLMSSTLGATSQLKDITFVKIEHLLLASITMLCSTSFSDSFPWQFLNSNYYSLTDSGIQ